jgi:beta-mannosidase
VRNVLIIIAFGALLAQAACNEVGGSGGELRERWEFRQAPKGSWSKATVPGCVHADLIANHLIPNPYLGTNENRLGWIEREDWEYRTFFDAGAELLGRERVELLFEGLDTYADVYLNDSLLARTDNMFRTWEIECKSLLRPGANALRIYFHSPVNQVADRWHALGCELPGGPQVMTRKAAYQYGWDFAPRFVTSGIWRPVRLVSWDAARIGDLWIVQRSLTETQADLTARFEIEATAPRRVSLEVQEGRRSLGILEADLVAGKNEFSIAFSIDKPKLWWTNGLGEPHLYTIRGIMKGAGAESDRRERRVGLRTIELVQAPDARGKSFCFKLNGVPVFMKGANYVPQDCFPTGVTRERYEWLLGCAQAAGMNMLRVWGGGIYENDLFYDLCDEMGILVWQDFMFACAMYPGDDAFLEKVRGEATDNVRRLRNHPCLALWCGNNEIDEAWHHWGWQRQYGYTAADSAKIWGDYRKLFLDLLPEVVSRYDGTRPYWPSSPSRGRAEPASLTEGDSHYWGIWHDGEPVEAFNEKIPRFMSEFGVESYPSFSTIMRFARPADWKLDSQIMLAHQKAAGGDSIMQRYMERSYRVPEDFRSFVYVSQLVQADALKTGIEAERRAEPYCMGSLFWQLDDCWPGASWSCLDYFGNPKAAYYRAGHAMSTVLVSPARSGDSLFVYIVSDSSETVRAFLKMELLDFSGNVRWTDRRDAEIPAGSSGVYSSLDARVLLANDDPAKVVFSVAVMDGARTLASNLFYFVPPKDLDLPKPEVRQVAQRVPSTLPSPERPAMPEYGNAPGEMPEPGRFPPGVYPVRLQTDFLAKSVYLSVPGVEGYFTDNFFDMLPGAVVSVWFITNRPVDDFARRLKITTLADVR